MDKKIIINNSSIIYFVLNIVLLTISLFLKQFYSNIGYSLSLVNITFVINIIILLLSIAFNIYLLLYNNISLKKVIISVVIISIIYSFMNFIMVPLLDKKYNSEYYKTTEKLVSYCKEFSCNKYETSNLKNKKKFSLEKNYTDYNSETQLIKFNVVYDKSGVSNIETVVYSSNESYSSYLIKEQISSYLSKFNVEIVEEKINEAFEKRDNNSIKHNDVIYKVESIYNKDNLDGFKTIMKISL